MAELIRAARAAQVESRQLRGEMLSLKRSLRESAAHSREQLRAAEVARLRVEARRDDPLPSAWSSLHWKCLHRELAGVLVSVPPG